DDHLAVKAARDLARRSETTFAVTFRLRSASGEYRWHMAQAIPTHDAQGRLDGGAGSGTDVDDQHRSEETARLPADASSVLGASLDLREILSRVCASAVPAAADLCAVHLRSDAGLVRELSTVPGLAEALNPPGADPLEALGVAEVLSSGALVCGKT